MGAGRGKQADCLQSVGASVREVGRYAVYKTGKTLYDPYTKESLGKEEVRVATLEIVEVKPKYAVARVVPGAEPAAAVPVGGSYAALCRMMAARHRRGRAARLTLWSAMRLAEE